MEDLISVIVPVYNVEKYLNRCVDSIINQTYKNLEIILVDDGSTDNCGKICDEYAKIDIRIKVIHKKNGGLSDARNNGIKEAIGKWITFVDSDDYLKSDFLYNLYCINKENKTSIAVAPYLIVTDKIIIKDNSIETNKKITQKEALKNMLLDREFTVSACSKLFKSSLFNDIKFPVGKIFEDTATTYKIIMKSDYISYCSKSGYCYYKRTNSILNSSYKRNQLQFIEFTDKMCSDILKKYDDLSFEVESKKLDCRYSILRRMVMTKRLSIDDKKEMEKIKKYILLKKDTIYKGKFNKKIKLATFLLAININAFKFGWILYYKLKYRRNAC